MPRVCKVCAHPRRAEIVNQLLARATTGTPSLRALAREYAVGKDSIERHASVCVPATLAAAARMGAIEQGIETAALLERYVMEAERIRLALHEQLRDPDDPDCFTLERRVSEIRVIYWQPTANGRWVRKKASLQELLDQVQRQLGIEIVERALPGPDPRMMFLDLLKAVPKLLALRAKLLGGKHKTLNDAERRDWSGWIKNIAAKYGKDVLEVARECWEVRPESRAQLEEEWPELRGEL
jgi:hypothetical protein